jgi:hypothetical protein
LKIVYIEWTDSKFIKESGWTDVMENQPIYCRSGGILLAQDKEAITITLNTCDSNTAPHSAPTTIPRRAITKFEILKDIA